MACIDADYDAAKVARDERKARIAKNEKQQLQNIQRAESTKRSSEIEKTLATTRGSTASMGRYVDGPILFTPGLLTEHHRFDKPLVGEKKLRGVKRKVHFTSLSILL
jgi:regulator of ribosome biosynthesis